VDAEKLFAEIKRVLKPNAVLFLTVPFIWGEHEVPYDFRRYTTYGIKRQVELLDMELVSLEKGSPGVSALIKLGISEVRHSRTTSALSKRLSRHWLKATQIVLERILRVEMERIYLRNIAVIRKRATG
jgi:SAM-dependent methyltransferase